MRRIDLQLWAAFFTLVLAISPSAASETGGLSKARILSNNIADTVEHTMPSVVVVRTEAVQYQIARSLWDGSVYRIPRSLAGQGSGVVISAEGHILTSYHVVKDADKIEVVFDDESKKVAEMVGHDESTDLAVLKVEADGNFQFHPIKIGDSDELRVGEIVIAVGSPFSLSGSVTMGIVSQKGRSVGILPYEDFIQTDASINPGNSGGPLVNVEGEMVGINAVIQTASPQIRGNIGIGFAIPANLALRVADAIMEHGRFVRPWIGILADHDPNDRDRTVGVKIGRVFDNSPAAAAGIKAGDIILSVENLSVRDISELQRLVMFRQPGEEIEIHIERDDKTEVLKLTPQPMPQQNVN